MPEAEGAAPSRVIRQNAMRATILETARSLAVHTGISDLSLSAVAADAGLNPSTVFAQFRNKDELLLAIVAEDLGMLAAAMRVRIAAKAEPHDMSHPPAADLGKLMLAESNGRAIENDFDRTTHSRSDRQSSLTLTKEQPSSSPIEQGVFVLEQLVEGLDSRLKEAEAGVMRAVVLSEESMKTLFDRMETFERQQKDVVSVLMQRVEETERRQRNTTSELRAAISDSATRVEILESVKRTHEGSRSDIAVSPSSMAAHTAESQTLELEAAPDNGGYREAAERAASAAATLASLENPFSGTTVGKLGVRIKLRRQHWISAACTIILVFALGGSIAFSLGEVHGHRLASTTSQIRTGTLHRMPVANAGKLGEARSVTRDARTQLEPRADPKTELLAGLHYLRGEGMQPDTSKAAELIRRAAERHDAVAEYWLGTLYEHGDGVPADAVSAVRWYVAAAMQGNRKAMHAMGVASAQGKGTRQNYSDAARWFTKGAQLGLVNSEFNLGVLYERGLGVPQSLTDAYRWYTVAAAQGDQESRARIEALKTQLSPEDISAAERSAASFRPLKADARANNVPGATTLASAH